MRCRFRGGVRAKISLLIVFLALYYRMSVIAPLWQHRCISQISAQYIQLVHFSSLDGGYVRSLSARLLASVSTLVAVRVHPGTQGIDREGQARAHGAHPPASAFCRASAESRRSTASAGAASGGTRGSARHVRRGGARHGHAGLSRFRAASAAAPAASRVMPRVSRTACCACVPHEFWQAIAPPTIALLRCALISLALSWRRRAGACRAQ